MAVKQSKFLTGALLIVGAVGYLIYTSIQQTKVYYFTIDEFLPKRAALTNTDVRVAGRVQDGSIQWDPAALNLTFRLMPIELGTIPVSDIPTGVPVSYQGILPDMFAEGRDVIVEGLYTPEQQLVASTIMTSCPSKYEPEIEERLQAS